jgi:hypothetical protein
MGKVCTMLDENTTLKNRRSERDSLSLYLTLQHAVHTLVDGRPNPSVLFCDEVKFGDLARIRSAFGIEKAVDVI